MRIGQVADLAGVNVQTLRYYEQLGLIEEPHRRESGHREYTTETVYEVRFIKAIQELGFSLKDIEEFIRLRKDRNACRSAYAFLESNLQVIDEKIKSLTGLRGSLEALMASCAPSPSTGECLVIEELLPASESCEACTETPNEHQSPGEGQKLIRPTRN